MAPSDRRSAHDSSRPSSGGRGAEPSGIAPRGASTQQREGSRPSSRGPDLRGANGATDRVRDGSGPDSRRESREARPGQEAWDMSRDGGRDRDRDRDRDRERRDRDRLRDGDRDSNPRPHSSSSLRSPPPVRSSAAASQSPAADSLRHSSVVADAARLVRERAARQAAAAAAAERRDQPDAASPLQVAEGKRKGRWVNDDGDAAAAAAESPESEAEDGELPRPAPAKRQRHEPVVWQASSDAAAGRGDEDGASPGIGKLGDLRAAALRRHEAAGAGAAPDAVAGGLRPTGGSPPSRPGSVLSGRLQQPSTSPQPRPLSALGRGGPHTAADIAAEELAAFQAARTGDLDYDPQAPPAVKASPSPSEGEGEPAPADGAGGGDAASEGSGEEGAPRRGFASRWHDEDAADDDAAGTESAAEAEAAVAALNAREMASLDASAPPSDEGSDSGDEASGHVRGVSMLRECRSVEEFERLNRISEGTYGVVYRAKEKATGRIVALKKVKMDKERDGFPLTAIREVNILLSFHHASIVDVSEVVVGRTLDSVFMVMEFMEHDLKQLLEDMPQPFSIAEVKALMWQLFDGIEYLHDNWVLHRDLKTSNILYNNRGELKICDFGLARQYGSPLKPYTHMVVTLWYRCPELLLGAREYSTAVDMWSLGCIMAELLSKEVLFDGRSELDQLDRIFKLLGSPNERIWTGLNKLPNARKIKFPDQPYNNLRSKFPLHSALGGSPGLSDAGFDLLNRLLTLDPEKRITAKAALNHKWFMETPQAKDKALMPTFPSRTEGMRSHQQKSPDPRVVETRRAELTKALNKKDGGLFSFSK